MAANKYFLNLKGNINHSVCRWCYDEYPLQELCDISKSMGIKSIDLIEPLFKIRKLSYLGHKLNLISYKYYCCLSMIYT